MEVTKETFEHLLEHIYKHGGNYEGPLQPEDFGVCYSDSYIKRVDEGDGMLQGSLPRSLRHLEESLADIWNEFDVILVSGLSGIIPGAIIANKYGKQLVVVRKDDDVTHGVRTEGKDYFAVGTPYILLDDMVASGRTLRRMLDKMVELGYDPPKYLVLYRAWSVWTDITWDGHKVEFDRLDHNLYAVRVLTDGSRGRSRWHEEA